MERYGCLIGGILLAIGFLIYLVVFRTSGGGL